MYVCLCRAVTSSQVREAIHAGASDVDALADELGVGTGCGCCREFAQMLIDEHATLPTAGTRASANAVGKNEPLFTLA